MIAAPCSGEPPEGVGYDPEIRRRRSGDRIEGLVVASCPRRHHQCAVGAEGITERLDQAEWSSLYGPYGAEGGVYEQNPTLLDSKCTELAHEFSCAEFFGGGLALDHAAK